MWKRILTSVAVLMVIALAVFVMVQNVSEAEAMEQTNATDFAVVEEHDQEKVVENMETEPVYIEKFTEVPLYFQTDYPDTPYGPYGDSVATDGCGIASVAMVFSYLLDEEILPDELAEEYGIHCTGNGSSWKLLSDSAEDYGVTIELQTMAWSNVVEALKNGRIVIANVGVSVFSPGGHFIVLHGISEDGKIFVRDPYKGNYAESSSDVLKDGFANGFDQEHIASHSYCWWIYGPKDVDALATQKNEANSTQAN